MTLALRQALSDAHGIIAMLGLDDHTYTHLSARLLREEGFLLTPFGLCFDEVDPSSLLAVSYDGILKKGEESWMNRTGYIIHSAIYTACPAVQAVFHLHTPETVAVSALAEGLLPLSQWALHFYDRVAYHTYDSLALEPQQGETLASSLHQRNVLFLRHHGIITVGKTIHEALFYAYHLQKACETQCKILAMSRPLITLSPEVSARANEDLLAFEKDIGRRDWEAWLRRLKRHRKNHILREAI